ncbi:glyoxalase/bleomycin resistance/extradiol dioxygenase family protein [Bacillus sp. EB600]|uniref:VOC family protein n=1 Tax=Bacillus sp. EB600 TaxID=2806345 RepID=UPI0021087C2B|nr:VOC family protein [Bacillus sp. EB600]MCQ6277652.1 VOC family protein [Bacillus sp. EB600]
MKSASSYIFVGNCLNVMKFYKGIFGGEITNIQKTGDGMCLHAELQLGNSIIHFSDTFGKTHGGDNVRISLECESEEEIRRVYNSLSKGGKITAELQDTFWGAIHANVVDQYGIGWLLNFQKKKDYS